MTTFDPNTEKPTGFRLTPDRGHKLIVAGTLSEVDRDVLIPYHAVDSVTDLNRDELEEMGIDVDTSLNWCVLVTASGLRYLVQQKASRFVNVWDSV